MSLLKKLNYSKLRLVLVYAFAGIGVMASISLIIISVRPDTLELVGIEEVSSDLYSCMTYKDPELLKKIYSGEVGLKEARAIVDSQVDIGTEYTQCLENIFGYNTVWVNRNTFIIYD
jgi:hypothetical protein